MILAIESSCDESALALFEPDAGLLREVISSQAEAHVRFGGVVPELASRMHLSALPLLLEDYRAELAAVETIAVTRGPGLLPCLSMGVSLARALALATGKPLVGVNHLRGHVHSPFIGLHAQSPAEFLARRAELLPHLGILISGGNTLLVRLDVDLRITVLARTVDDAAGEAFDKGAKLLGLPYPGGALIEQHASRGDVRKYVFPRGIPEKADLRMSFSGLKTALRYQLEKMTDAELATDLPDLCAGYQHAIIEQLVSKTGAALDRAAYKSVGLSGGVANNRTLRQRLTNVALQRGLPMLIAEPKHCGDNAGMIAFAAWADRGLPTGTAAAPAPALTVEET
jgi:N6-L-threonylcarbamoyladenine synthase